MSSPPSYFEAIRKRSADRWDQLEGDKELAAPWHQLFKQIQSPRHVVSELLQNADDADATQASVELGDARFLFRHNGEDFQEQHFASLCRFGYSNKRSLHTIGFRGIGFKSTFSLGDEVRVLTPTLQVAFHRHRFTEPVWLETDEDHGGATLFSVAIRDGHRENEIKKNLASWLESPTSLLFFRSLRSLRIDAQEVTWQSGGQGPIPYSEWLSLAGTDDAPVLIIRSGAEAFPDEALAEIRQERMIDDAEDSHLPPSTIEIVLGLEGRLFVVLPTGVKTSLPFACNAPFIQDPARLKIKDPETSPTNRWLLERVGRLAASAMLDWLSRTDLSGHERSRAYELLVESGQFDDSLDGACEAIVAASFHDCICEAPFLLTESGDLVAQGDCLAVPTWLTDVWSSTQIAALFDDRGRPILAQSVDADARSVLARSGYLPELSIGSILQVLRAQHLPRPDSWISLLNLWDAVAEEVTARRQSWQPSWKDICILPVKGQDCLFSAPEIVRLGEKRLLRSDDDWEFLARHLLVMNPNWTRFIAEQRRAAEASQDEDLGEMVHNADRVLEALGMDDTSDVSRVIERVSQAFFSDAETTDHECIRLAQIAAALDANVPHQFQFIARNDNRISRAKHGPVIADVESDLDTFIAEEWCERHALHADYSSQLRSCTASEWRHWIESNRSGLLRFVPIVQFTRQLHRRAELTQFLQQRGYEGQIYYPYVTHNFVVEDWDFAPEHWQHWETLAQEDPTFWGRLLNRILQQPPAYWQQSLAAKAFQIATTGSRQQIGPATLAPAWIMKLRSCACLQDTWGNFRAPAELLRRTPDTEALLDVEPFVRAEVDTETTRSLLASLGVRDTPTGTERLLERLKALASVPNPPFFEVQKWCHRLDSVAAKCTTEELAALKEAFHSHRLVFTSNGAWATASEVFLNAGDEAPGVPLVHPELKSLTLWQRIDVEERPTVELVLEWLGSLQTNSKLSADDLKRVREVLTRFPTRVWDDCGCWLNLEGEWVTVDRLRYQLSMQLLVANRHLFPAIRQQIADLQRLPYEVVNQPPFCYLPSLASAIAERVQIDLTTSSAPKVVAWITALGNGIARVAFDDAEKTARVQQHGRRLANTHWLTLSPLETIPYIDGTPAGTGRTTDVVWDGTLLYVDDKPMARLFRPIAQELARAFEDEELADAIKTCVERSPEFITDYLGQNFTLQSVEGAEEVPRAPDSSISTESTTSGTQSDSADIEFADHDEAPMEETSQADDSFVSGDEELSADDAGDWEEPTERRPDGASPARPSQAPLIERYAHSNGFRKDGAQGRYYHSDGRWIQRANGHAFPWEIYSTDGELARCLWTREHCLERDPLQLPAEIWELCNNSPDAYSLVTTTPDGKPLELSGKCLQDMKDQGKIKLFPATYRLVFQNA